MQAAIDAVSQARSTPDVRLVLPHGFAAAALVRALAPRATEVVEDSVPAVVVEAAAEDPAVVRARLEEEIARARAELDRARGHARERALHVKAPPHKVEEERAKAARFAAEVRELEARLAGAWRDGRPTPTSTRSSSSACASASSACTGCSTARATPSARSTPSTSSARTARARPRSTPRRSCCAEGIAPARTSRRI